jgi:RNA polymerase subunit RPABC4/transcription elongation factor Spt4
MVPAQGDPSYAYSTPQPQEASTQKVCSKCGRAIPPGSSLCPVHGKFGGGNKLNEGEPLLPGRHTGPLWQKIDEKRAAAAARHAPAAMHRTPPEQVFPQMAAAPQFAAPTPPPQEAGQRICPACSNPVPDRSRVCPVCGCNRLPPERSKPFVKAEDRYKAMAEAPQGYPPFPTQPGP